MHTWYMWLSHRRRRPGRSGGTGCSPRVSVCGRVLCVVGCCVWSGAVCGRVLCVVGCSPHVCVVRRHWLRVCVDPADALVCACSCRYCRLLISTTAALPAPLMGSSCGVEALCAVGATRGGPPGLARLGDGASWLDTDQR
jgi:hypothetical protein